MNITPISRLPNATSLSSSYIPISQQDQANVFSTRKIQYESLRDDILYAVRQKYGIRQGFGDEVDNILSTILSGDITYKGQTTFEKLPMCSHNASCDNQLINKKYLETCISGKIGSIGINKNSYIENIENIVLNGSENSQEIQHSGLLVINGWVAAPTDIATANCYVDLMGEIYKSKNGEKSSAEFITLQRFPWIVGSKSSFIQNVSFSVFVKSGLTIKVKPGFSVNSSSSGYNGINVNELTGYVIVNV